MASGGPDRVSPPALPDAELPAADHVLWASAPATRALFEGRGL
jgi:hypothetical protein